MLAKKKKWPSNPTLGWGISTQFCPFREGIEQSNFQMLGGGGKGKWWNFKLIDALLFMVCPCFISFWPALNQNISTSTFLCIFYKHSWAYFFTGGSLTTSGLGGSGLKNSQQDSFDCTPVQQLVGFYNKSHQFVYPVRALYQNSSQS